MCRIYIGRIAAPALLFAEGLGMIDKLQGNAAFFPIHEYCRFAPDHRPSD
jgi:hypothetical protein